VLPTPKEQAVPAWRDPAHKYVMKGIAWGLSPETKRGVLFERDDFMAEAAAPYWAPWGRADFETMKALGANTVRLYGLDISQNHTLALNEAHKNGLSMIAGVSDWPYLQMPGNCQETGGVCYKQLFEWYKAALNSGYTVMDGDVRSYHPAVRAMILINEPEIGKFSNDKRTQCSVVASAMDAVLDAENDLGVYGNPIAFTVAYSMAGFYGTPALGQMLMLYDCMKDPKGKGGYTPKNDLWNAYTSRFVNSFNTHNNAGTIRSLILDKYRYSVFWKNGVNIPIFVGEYDASSEGQKYDLSSMMKSTADNRYPFFMGINFFEYQARYDKLANWQHEMTFGMYGLDFNCDMGTLEWWGGGESFGMGFYSGKNYTINSLVPRKDVRGYSKPRALAEAYGGDESKVDYSCKKIVKPADFMCYGCWSQG
jgi:hypothetical protein